MTQPRQLSLATLNLENLHPPGVAFYNKPIGWTDAEYAGKKAWTAQALHRLDADVIGFQELWHRDALADVFAHAGLADDYELAAPEPVTNRIASAIAVRNPHRLVDVAWIADFADRLVLRRRGWSLADTD